MSRLKLGLCLLLASPGMAMAEVVWRGDFETGNISQWTKSQAVNADRLQVVRSPEPVREGACALKVTVRQGDNPINASGNRNELLYLSREEPGSEYVYKWSTLFPNDYPSVNKWQLFAQWHHEGCCGSPPIEMYTVGENIHLRVGGANGQIVWTGPLQRGQWRDFILRVKWSPDPVQGFVEMYLDGALALPKTMAATMYGNERNYLKLGLYRDGSIAPTGTVFHDGFVQATSLGDVMGAAGSTPPPPAQEPPPTTPEEAGHQAAPSASSLPDEQETDAQALTGTGFEQDPVSGAAGGCSQGAAGASAATAMGLAMLSLAMLPRRRNVPTLR